MLYYKQARRKKNKNILDIFKELLNLICWSNISKDIGFQHGNFKWNNYSSNVLVYDFYYMKNHYKSVLSLIRKKFISICQLLYGIILSQALIAILFERVHIFLRDN
jgi:hypothetical protein